MGIITDLTAVADSLIGIRDDIGAAIHQVYFLTRTWSGTQPGDGTPTDVAVLMNPSPGVGDLSHKFAVAEPGRYKQGDLQLKMVSKQAYSSEDTIRLKSTSRNVEKFYRINSELYTVVHVKENYIYWTVHIRRIAQ